MTITDQTPAVPGDEKLRPAAGAELGIDGGRVLVDGTLADTAIVIAGGAIGNLAGGRSPRRRIDARGLLVLPGIVDLHGDAFERQIMPRPGVHFPIDVALHDSDRQAVANGITTVFHGVTCSWEPGLRGVESARAILTCLEKLRPHLSADTRYHLRYETYHLDAEEEVAGWLAARRIDALAFNDHMTSTLAARNRDDQMAQMAKRSGLDDADFERLMARVRGRAGEVPASIERLARTAVASGVPLISHDDRSPDQRGWYRSLGCMVAEFPINIETARDAALHGDHIVFGAPNVVRGGSHIGWTSATDMVAQGLCSVLASDYYYPAQFLAAFRLAAIGIAPLGQAWALISETPAAAAGLTDRGRIAAGHRADLLLVDARIPERPRIVATIVAGRIVHCVETERLSGV